MFEPESIYLAAILHGLFQVAVLLFNRRGNRRANAVLALLVGVIVLCMWNLYVYVADLPRHWLVIDYSYWSSIYLWGPALYIYVGFISAQLRLGARLFLRHFWIAGALAAFQLPLYFLSRNGLVTPDQVALFGRVVLVAFYVHMSVYFVLCFKVLRAYHRTLKQHHSHLDSINLSWLTRLTAIFACALAVDMVLSLTAMAQGETSPYVAVYLAAEAIVVFAIGYFSLSHPEVLFPAVAEAERPRSIGTPLDEDLASTLTAKLDAAMRETHAYRKNDLRLSELAELVGVSGPLLSQVINQHHGKNFYDYVNEFRVRAAAERLAADRKANIEKVAFDAGFNNRVSFNNAFKKYMQMTPSQYRGGRRMEPVRLDAQNDTA